MVYNGRLIPHAPVRTGAGQGSRGGSVDRGNDGGKEYSQLRGGAGFFNSSSGCGPAQKLLERFAALNDDAMVWSQTDTLRLQKPDGGGMVVRFTIQGMARGQPTPLEAAMRLEAKVGRDAVRNARE